MYIYWYHHIIFKYGKKAKLTRHRYWQFYPVYQNQSCLPKYFKKCGRYGLILEKEVERPLSMGKTFLK